MTGTRTSCGMRSELNRLVRATILCTGLLLAVSVAPARGQCPPATPTSINSAYTFTDCNCGDLTVAAGAVASLLGASLNVSCNVVVAGNLSLGAYAADSQLVLRVGGFFNITATGYVSVAWVRLSAGAGIYLRGPIDGAGKGYRGGVPHVYSGYTCCGMASPTVGDSLNYGGNGGPHAAAGGTGNGNAPQVQYYDNPASPDACHMGSGGAWATTPGAYGGGAVILWAPVVHVGAPISVRGADALGYASQLTTTSGGGAGGCVVIVAAQITASTIGGPVTINANGGDAPTAQVARGGGGGGGSVLLRAPSQPDSAHLPVSVSSGLGADALLGEGYYDTDISPFSPAPDLPSACLGTSSGAQMTGLTSDTTTSTSTSSSTSTSTSSTTSAVATTSTMSTGSGNSGSATTSTTTPTTTTSTTRASSGATSTTAATATSTTTEIGDGATTDASTATTDTTPTATAAAAVVSSGGAAKSSSSSSLTLRVLAAVLALLVIVAGALLLMWLRRRARAPDAQASAPLTDDTRKMNLAQSSRAAQVQVLLDHKSTSLLGAGMTAQVYKVRLAERRKGNAEQWAAVKVFTLNNPAAEGEFHAEVAILGTLGEARHPNVVGLHYICSEPTMHAIVMDLIDGGSVMQFITGDATLPSDAQVTMATEIACGMEFLHQHGVAHLDLKPANLLVDRASSGVKIVDFGASVLCDNDKPVTQGVFVGTLQYCAPERLMQGAAVRLKPTDVYAYGVTLWALINRRVPHAGESTEAILSAKRDAAAGVAASMLAYATTSSTHSSAASTVPFASTDSLLPAAWESESTLTALVVQCCSTDPLARPTFTQIRQTLRDVAPLSS